MRLGNVKTIKHILRESHLLPQALNNYVTAEA
jgi:hypothetical protein